LKVKTADGRRGKWREEETAGRVPWRAILFTSHVVPLCACKFCMPSSPVADQSLLLDKQPRMHALKLGLLSGCSIRRVTTLRVHIITHRCCITLQINKTDYYASSLRIRSINRDVVSISLGPQPIQSVETELRHCCVRICIGRLLMTLHNIAL
jgi:hypothetical protein